MGRIGRACLYASVALATSAAGVLGASQESLPGDTLYGVKLRIEQLRFEVVPAHLQGVLAADVVAERLEEMERLVDAGRTAEAVAMQPTIASDIDHLVTVEAAGSSESRDRIARHLLALGALIDKLPASAEAAVRAGWDDLASRGAGDGLSPDHSAPGNGAVSIPSTSGSGSAGGDGSSGSSNAGVRVEPSRSDPRPSEADGELGTRGPPSTDHPRGPEPSELGARAPGHGSESRRKPQPVSELVSPPTQMSRGSLPHRIRTCGADRCMRVPPGHPRTSEDGVEANLYPVPARGAGSTTEHPSGSPSHGLP